MKKEKFAENVNNESMVGKPWESQEESELIEEFNSGMTIANIAAKHKRNEGGICARLRKLGLIE